MNSDTKKCLEQLVEQKIERMQKDKSTMIHYLFQNVLYSRKKRSILIEKGLQMIDEAIIYLKKE
jgi:hypothetical protein